MMSAPVYRLPARLAAGCVAAAAALACPPLAAGDFSVTPIRAELKAGVLSETITVVNHANTRLRVSVKLMEWTQDASGADVYKETADLVYFPRQLEIEPEGKRLVRVGAKAPAGVAERTYRLFIEEEPEPTQAQGNAQVAFYLRFGVPVFLTPATARPQPEVGEPALEKGKVSIAVRNTGNQHFRLNKITLSDGASYSQDVAGWYSLAGSQRIYTATLPPDVCRRLKVLNIGLEGEGVRIDRKLNVDPALCA